MSELYPPPSAPPPSHGQSDWPIVLAGVLGSAYGLVMLLLLTTWLCRRRKSVIGLETPLAAAEGGAAPVLVATAVPCAEPEQSAIFKTVHRGRSAWFAGSTQPGIDLASIERQVRMGFVRKVYALLSTQLLMTVAIVTLFIWRAFPTWQPCNLLIASDGSLVRCATMSAFGFGILTNSWVIWAAFVPLLIMVCCMHTVKNTYPLNYAALFLFTAVESAVVAILCVMYYGAGYGEQILIAFGVTVGIFLVLTLFTLQSKVDWGFLGPGLCAALFILVFWSWMTFWLVPYASFGFSKLFSLFGALLFCGFIIYDTNNIMRHFGVDDWLIAAIELYLDVINLFLFLLQLLSGGGRQN